MNALLFLQVPLLHGQRDAGYAALELDTDPMAYEWLRLGVRAALEDNREDARYYFVQAVRTDLNYARAWLYLGGVADDPALTLSCLQKVLQLEPEEPQAWAGLIWARNKLGLIQPSLPIFLPQAPVPPAPDPAEFAAHEPISLDALSPEAAAGEWAIWGGPATPRVAESPMPIFSAPDAPAPTVPTPPAGALPLTTWALGPEDPEESLALMKRGVSAAANSDRARARYYFLKAIAADAGNTRAWLYLGGVAQDPGTTLACMERVLQEEPENAEARHGAAWAAQQLEAVAFAHRDR